MAKRMLVDATHPEETRVVVVSGNRLEELDFEIASRKQLKGNIYLAKVVRVEPSLQAAFVEYGGNRHGFLAFSEIHPDYYRIPVADREALMREYAAAVDAEYVEDSAGSDLANDLANDMDEGGDGIEEAGGEPANPDETGGAAPAPVADGDDDDVYGSDEGDDGDDPAPRSMAAASDRPESVSEAVADGGTPAEPAPDAAGPTQDDEADAATAAAEASDIGDEGESPLSAPSGDVERQEDAADATGTDGDTDGETDGPVEAPAGEPADDQEDGDGGVELRHYSGDSGNGGEARPEGRDGGRRDRGRRRFRRGDTRDGREGREGRESRDGRGTGDAEARSTGNQEEPAAEEEGEQRRSARPRPLKSYKIQEVIKRRQILLVQVTKEERGNKGAALTTYLSLPGRYCVLMPNTPRGGGISRKITNPADRKRLKELMEGLDIPQGMSVILRTAGIERSKPEIKRDLEYLMRLWDSIRELTLQSVAPALIYEEANLIKRAIRDLYAADIDEVLVEGEGGYRTAKDFMRMLMPSHTRKVQQYREEIPLFHRFQVEGSIETMFNPVCQLRSGGYIVINQTEALVAIDVNSGRSTKERNIEETALKTNLEAADEIARQLRLRDLAGLIVIDFIDMEDPRNNAAVEKRLKEAMKADRARIQLGRISSFGLLELSRQRLRPSLQEINFERCPHCAGTGLIRSQESAALAVLRAIEEEGIRRRSAEITVTAHGSVTLYILNQKREALQEIERRYGFRVYMAADDSLIAPEHRLERIKTRQPGEELAAAPVSAERIFAETDRALEAEETEAEIIAETEAAAEVAPEEAPAPAAAAAAAAGPNGDRDGNRRRRRRRRRRNGRGGEMQGTGTEGVDIGDEESDGEEDGAFEPADGDAPAEPVDAQPQEAQPADAEAEAADTAEGPEGEDGDEEERNRRKRRRGKRGGRRRTRLPGEAETLEDAGSMADEAAPAEPAAPVDADAIAAGREPPVAAPAVELPAAAEAQAALAAEDAAVTEPTAEAPAKPKRTRRKKADAEAPVEAPATQDQAAQDQAVQDQAAPEPAADEAAPAKPKRTRRKKADAEAPAEVAVEAPAAREPAAEAPAAEDAAPAKPKRTRRKKAETEAPAEAAAAPVVSEPAPGPQAAPAGEEDAPAPETAAAETPVVVNPPVESPRRGWWSRKG